MKKNTFKRATELISTYFSECQLQPEYDKQTGLISIKAVLNTPLSVFTIFPPRGFVIAWFSVDKVNNTFRFMLCITEQAFDQLYPQSDGKQAFESLVPSA